MIGRRKGGSSSARAQRAKQGHHKRRARNILGSPRHYKGGSKRTKGAWRF